MSSDRTTSRVEIVLQFEASPKGDLSCPCFDHGIVPEPKHRIRALSGRRGPAVAAVVVAVVIALAVVVPAVRLPFTAGEQPARARAGGAASVRAPAAKQPAARRVVVVGDSVAVTLFPGFARHQRGSGVVFVDRAESGCPLGIGAQAHRNDGEAGTPEHLDRVCEWPKVWPPMLRATHPDLVVALWGLWDVLDVEVGGTWLRVGSPEWIRHMTETLNRALDVLTAGGAHVVILTTPYLLIASGWRTDALNAVFREVAAQRPQTVTVVDTQGPTDSLHPRRWDSVHYTWRGAARLVGALLPDILRALPPR